MVNILKVGFIILLLLCYDLMFCQTFNIGISDFQTNSFYIENGEIKGSIGSIYHCILTNSAMTYTIQDLPQARVLLYLETGQIDIGFPLTPSINRDLIAEYTTSVLDIPYSIFTLDNNLKQGDLLKSREIGTQIGSYLLDIVKDSGATFHEFGTYSQAIEMVLSGRIYGAIIPSVFLEDLTEIEISLGNVIQWGVYPIGFYISKKSPFKSEIIKALEAGLKKCK